MTLQDLTARMSTAFAAARPRSAALAAEARAHWRGGAPLHWMGDWAGPFPIFAAQAHGARLSDVDGHVYDDFCLGDTPSMFGHGRPELAQALADQAQAGVGYMLPTAAAVTVGRRLSERFGPMLWQAAVSATDANRCALRWARAVTGRPAVLIFDGAYHGAVDETFVTLKDGAVVHKAGLIGQAQDLRPLTRVINFNDLDALAAALAPVDVAAVLAEPVMTNCGMILPDPGFHAALRALTEASGTLLILDETHTLSEGPGGYGRAHGLSPDVFTLGKAVAGGFPAAVWGVTPALAVRMDAAQAAAGPGYSGMGTTLSGSALAMAALEAMLDKVMTPAAYAVMLSGAQALEAGLAGAVARRGRAWSVVRSGARVELVLTAPAPRNAAQMRAAADPALSRALHLYLIQQGVLIAPFHQMMLISPQTGADQIERLILAVDGFMQTLEDLGL